MKRLLIILPIVLLAASGIYLLISRYARPGAARPAVVAAGYAGSARCAECHPKETALWNQSHHAGAQRRISAELDEQAFEPARTISHGSQISTAQVKNGQFTLSTLGSDGKVHDYVPVGVIGVNPLWQYLIEAPGGRLQVTELAFDPAKKEWFDVYGQEDRQPWEWGHWSNRGMNWNSMCATCHTTGYEKNYNAGTDSYASSWHELGVGCEACHGPMRGHADWQSGHRGQTDDPTLKTIDRYQYFQVCASCHARRQELTGRFTPGEEFLDHFDPALPDESEVFYPDGQVHDEDFEFSAFMMSYMHGQGVLCSNCHSSHSGKLYLPVSDLCLQCHAQGVTNKIPLDDPPAHTHHEEGTPGSFCTDCHMPITAYMQRHRRHDHGLTIPDPQLTKEHGIPNACNRCHADKSTDWAITQVEEWYGERMNRPTRTRARLMARAKAGDAGVIPELIAYLEQEKNPTWRAIGLKFLGALEPKAGPADGARMLSAAAQWLDDPDPLLQAAAVEMAQFSPTAAGKLTEKLSSPNRLVRLRAAWALRSTLDLSVEAGRDLEQTLLLGEDQQIGAFQRGNLLRDRGQTKEALDWYAKAARWGLGTSVFHYQYAVALDDAGRPQEAVDALLQALKLEPHNAHYLFSLGLMYGELNQFEGARDALRLAVAGDAGQARYWYNLAIIEIKLNETEAALAAIGKAEQLDAANAEYPYLRATVFQSLQQKEQVRAALERALQIDPTHAPSRQMLRELE